MLDVKTKKPQLFISEKWPFLYLIIYPPDKEIHTCVHQFSLLVCSCRALTCPPWKIHLFPGRVAIPDCRRSTCGFTTAVCLACSAESALSVVSAEVCIPQPPHFINNWDEPMAIGINTTFIQVLAAQRGWYEWEGVGGAIIYWVALLPKSSLEVCGLFLKNNVRDMNSAFKWRVATHTFPHE